MFFEPMKSKLLYPFALLLALGLSSFGGCNKDDDEPAPPTCAMTATFRNNICGVGVWGAYVLELENGDIVQPWDAPADVAKFSPEPNLKIRVTVSTVARDGRYDNTIVCMAYGPYTDKIARQVRIDCIAADGSSK
jgi:hypothetical protein